MRGRENRLSLQRLCFSTFSGSLVAFSSLRNGRVKGVVDGPRLFLFDTTSPATDLLISDGFPGHITFSYFGVPFQPLFMDLSPL